MSDTSAVLGRMPGWTGSFARQASHHLKLTLRSSRALTSALMLPILILVALRTTTGDDAASHTYLVAGAVVFGCISMSFVTHATWLVTAREKGVMKRLRATPLRPSAFLAGRIAATAVLSLVAAAITVVIARFVVGVDLRLELAGPIVSAVLLGTVTWAALGTLLSGFIGSPASAWSILSIVYLPLMFISGVFFPSSSLPAWLNQVSSYLPAEPFGQLMQQAFAGHALAGRDLLVMSAWAVVCAVASIWTFKWQPSEPSKRRATHTVDSGK
ncbi:ABC transporter permease [Amycolatopsis samaneae]|uniref:Transport permease protein n=1 Tax=Amycolatopsis samaneae TaxID=664691 RepID=A0ABW5GPE6_9PSEU